MSRFDYLENLREIQNESVRKSEEKLAAMQAEQENYMQSEQYERDVWEAKEDAWERKAKKEGRTYVRKPFVSALQRQRMEEQAKQEEIAYLQQRLKALQTAD